METTDGWLLGGAVRYRQPAHGHRTGIEPVFLAAAVPARPGQRVLEGGTGAGAALLCLAHRVPGIFGLGVERDEILAALAADNFAANGFAGLRATECDIAALAEGGFDHAMANPPWHDPAGTPSPIAAQERARRAGPDTARTWTQALGRALHSGGTLTLILSAGALPSYLACLTEAGCGSPVVLPLWPRAGQPAKLVLLRAVSGGRAALRTGTGRVLHDAAGRFTPEAEAILRGGAPLTEL